MKSNTSLFVGLAIAVLAVFAILDSLNIPFHISSLLWIIAFASVSAVFFFAYLINGLHVWKWFYPACIFAALSEIVLILSVDRINDAWSLVFGLASIFIPSLIGYFIDCPRRISLSMIASGSIHY